MKRTSTARVGITGAAIVLALVLAGCRDGSATPSGDTDGGDRRSGSVRRPPALPVHRPS